MHRRHALTLIAIAPVAATLPGCSSGDAGTGLPTISVGDRALAFGQDGTVVELKSAESRIEQAATATTPGWSYGGNLLPDSRPVQPVGVLVTATRRFVLEPGRLRVTVLDRRGTLLGELEPSAPSGNRPLYAPAEGPDGRVWFIDRKNRRLESFAAEGEPAGGFAWPADAALPRAFAFDAYGRLHVLDAAGGVSIVDAQGRLIGRYGERGSGPGQMLRPHAIEIDAGGIAVIADGTMAALHCFDRDGRHVLSRRVSTAAGAPGVPRSLARRPDGGVYVHVVADPTRGAAYASFVHLS
jgi:hypothetical protein